MIKPFGIKQKSEDIGKFYYGIWGQDLGCALRRLENNLQETIAAIWNYSRILTIALSILMETKNFLNYLIDPPLNVICRKRNLKSWYIIFIAGRLSRKKAKNIQAL